ncbi:MAG: hypothetical protein EBQ95_05795 [Gammaproteobacteria bacterium]|nr:hypothetical protein [Gammaproteobacteria bacterium]
MHFLWKLFLDEERLPYIIFTNQLKTRLMALLPHAVVATAPNQASPNQDASDGSDVIFTSVTSKNTSLNADIDMPALQACGNDVFSE